MQAQPPLTFLPPRFDPLVAQVLNWIVPSWLRLGTNVGELEAEHVERLVELYREFDAGKVRFMLAFRHPTANDPFCLAYLLARHVPATAKRMGVELRQPVHMHFIYDRGIPIWAGKWVEWLYPRLGGTPIQRGKLDRQGLRSIRDLFAFGRFPIMAAPEGATNGHSERVSPLEPGVAQMGFWCAEDLRKANREEKVVILPVGIQYRYRQAPWGEIRETLVAMERDLGITGPVPAEIPVPAASGSAEDQGQLRELYPRLYRIGVHLLGLMEGFYTRFHHQSLPSPEGRSLNDRLQALLDTALRVAEEFFKLQPKGTVVDRCRRLEQAAWDCIYREDLKQIDQLSAVEKSLADRIAEEADLRIWHMRLVESFVAVTGQYVAEKPTAERFSETLLLTWETVARLKGEPAHPRPIRAKMVARLTMGEPISVSDRWAAYETDRRSARKEVERLTQDLQSALEGMIV
jgi:hypothetical protein